MGKTSRWFHSLLGSKKSPSASSLSMPAEKKKSKWGLSKPSTSNAYKNEEEQPQFTSPPVEAFDANKHAVAVAAATAAVAEAALAAAKAAAEAVKLINVGQGRSAAVFVNGEHRRELAGIKIQSAFRAYSARRALRALKGLVKLQALVRGRIVRKQSADMLRRMQAMARIQARACKHRAHVSESANLLKRKCDKRSNWAHHEHMRKQGSRLDGSNWLDHWMDKYTWNNQKHSSQPWDDQKSDKILEIDTWNPRTLSSNDLPLRSSNFPPKVDPVVSSRRNPFSPTRSECSKSLFGEYLGYPNYMAYTEASLAKLRSQSAPRQRMLYEDHRMGTRFAPDVWDTDMYSEKGSTYTSKGHPFSSHLKKLGKPIQDPTVSYSSMYGYRY